MVIQSRCKGAQLLARQKGAKRRSSCNHSNTTDRSHVPVAAAVLLQSLV